MITITNSRPEHFAGLEHLQRIAYPTLDPSHLLRGPHFEAHLQLFPDGQFVALDGDHVVGMTSTFRTTYDFEHPDHTFDDIITGGTFSNHDPNGPWLYGADVSVLPQYRGQGVGSRLYDARRTLCRRLNLRGQIAGGMMPGYRHYRDQMSVEQYAAAVAAGELHDPTLSVQLRNGFQVRGILRNYLHDEQLGNEATLIVWDNPDYAPDPPH